MFIIHPALSKLPGGHVGKKIDQSGKWIWVHFPSILYVNMFLKDEEIKFSAYIEPCPIAWQLRASKQLSVGQVDSNNVSSQLFDI